MKQRTTFLLDTLESIDTDNAVFTEELVSLPGSLIQARQDRLTVALDELPLEMAELFKKLYMFRVQWSSVGAQHLPVFQNFGLDGFSVHLIPTTMDYESSFDEMGTFIQKHFGVGFDNSTLISTATSASFHKVTQIKSSTFQNFLNQIADRLDRISFVQSFDLRWESQSLVIEWTTDPYEANIRRSPTIRKEVALFQAQPLLSQEDIELSGIRMVLSEEEYTPPTKTLLIVKPRHNVENSTVAFQFEEPLGLHPSLQITELNENAPPYPECELFMFSTLPNTLFFDKYQYDEKHMTLLTSWGEDDLEAPVWKVSKFGSQQLFHIISRNANIGVKFHSRYIKPSDENTFDMITPEIFWACDSEDFMEPEESAKIVGNPFESYNLGFESFFEPSTVFYHLKKDVAKLEYTIPTADKNDYNSVQITTVLVVLVGTLYLLKKMVDAYFTMALKNDNTDESKKEK